MSIQHALLTSLLEQPSSGYGLAQRFDHSFGYFWQATHQQIYRELARMAGAGWIKAEQDDKSSARRRKVYHVLPAGHDELARWVRSADLSVSQTQSLLVKLRADAIIGPLGLSDQLQVLIEQHKERLVLYLSIEKRDFQGQLDRAQRLRHIVLQNGITKEESWLSWASELLLLLEDDVPHDVSMHERMPG